MFLDFNRNKFYALCGNSEKAVLAEVTTRPGTDELALEQVACGEGTGTTQENVSKALDIVQPLSGGVVSIAMPLNLFIVNSLTLPLMPDEAIQKALPYHLSKVLDKPLEAYVYDWQVMKRKKDKLQLEVYLFPAETYFEIEEKLAAKRLKTTYFEADVFAVFAYLDRLGKLKEDETVLCAIIWPQSLSFAVCNNGRIVLSRAIKLEQPKDIVAESTAEEPTVDEPGEGHKLPEEVESSGNDTNQLPLEVTTAENESSEPEGKIEINFEFSDPQKTPTEPQETTSDVSPENGANSLLADFDILVADSGEQTPVSPTSVVEEEQQAPHEDISAETLETESAPEVGNQFEEYIDAISFEVVRTKDYYASIMKGSSINTYYFAGAELFFDNLVEKLSHSVDAEIYPLTDASEGDVDHPGLRVVGLGTGVRW